MNKQQKIIAMIPARMGSTRLKKKNLALLGGKPMIYYAIQAAKDSGVFSSIIVNSEDETFADIARENKVEFYHRPAVLGTSQARSDEIVYDFMRHNPGDLTAWINPTSPLQTANEVRRVVDYFSQNDLDSLITVYEERVHCLLGGQPLNFREAGPFARTQDLQPIQRFVYSIMMWKNETFLWAYEKQGYALLCGKTGYYPVSKETSLIIKTADDLHLVEQIMKGRETNGDQRIRYEQIGGER